MWTPSEEKQAGLRANYLIFEGVPSGIRTRVYATITSSPLLANNYMVRSSRKMGTTKTRGSFEMGDVGSKATSGNPGRSDPGSVLPPALADGGQPRAVELRHRDA